ncbi:MAG: hypothetical protein K8H99_01285 [Nitrospirae bacterium]|nr:hypothetical protein [Fimbriimonadaceae bacterium]
MITLSLALALFATGVDSEVQANAQPSKLPGYVYFEVNGKPPFEPDSIRLRTYTMTGELLEDFHTNLEEGNVVSFEVLRTTAGQDVRVPKGRYQVILSWGTALDKRVVFDYDPAKALVLPKVELQFGDVDRDGELTKEDQSYIMSQMGRKKDFDFWYTATDLKFRVPADADLNFDGVVDTWDNHLFMVAMQKKHDKPLIEKKK